MKRSPSTCATQLLARLQTALIMGDQIITALNGTNARFSRFFRDNA